mgnify:CR=1 FL=1
MSSTLEIDLAEDHKQDENPKSELIKTQLQRAFTDRASEDLPDELMSLIGKLKEQDAKNGK